MKPVGPSDGLVYHRNLPGGFMYELRRGGKGWEARRAEGDAWVTARSAAFALIHAYGGEGEPDAFGVAARAWGLELER